MTEPARLEGALALLRSGRFADAERDLKALVSRAPQDADAMQLLGIAVNSQGRLEEGLAWLDRAKALRPRNVALMQNRAHTLFQLGRFDAARAEAQAITSIEPNHPAARDMDARIVHEEGVAHHSAGRFAAAVDAYKRAIAAGLTLPQVQVNLATALRHLANELSAEGKKEEAARMLRDALKRNPSDENALSDLGAVLIDLSDLAGARESLEAALRVKPDFPLALNNLGLVLRDEGRIDEAAAAFDRALTVQPGYARAAYNLALARLTRERFEEGWKLYDARFRAVPPQSLWRDFPVPRFTSGDFGAGHRVAIWREQGIGDQVLYASTLADLEQRGEAFALEFDARLVPALRRAHPRWTIVGPDESAEAFAKCDRHAPLADMAGLLRPDAKSFDRQPRAFLAADPERAAGYRARIASPGRRVIGVSWRSFQKKDRARLEATKSAPLVAFAALAARPDLKLLDLQYGDTAGERSWFNGELARIDELDLFNDLDGLLAAIDVCDVVVTTSSVTAHLAGASGKRTLLLYLKAIPPFHYWATDASGRCRWYPSVQVVTGESIDTWPRAIARVDEILRG